MLKKNTSLMLVAVLMFSLSIPAYASEVENTAPTVTSDVTEPAEQPETTEPSVPATTAPAQPTTTEPPETTVPTQPPETEPPATTAPTQPTETEPPETTEPTQPAETEPTEPIATEPEQPTDPSDPPTEPTVPTTPTEPQIPTALEIDTEHIYHGMDMAYEDGYIPRVSDGYMHLVLPLKTNGDIYAEKIDVSLSMDTSPSSPFVVENFRKTFYLDDVTPKDTEEEQEVFLVEFFVGLSDNRTNGIYPVTVNITGFDSTAKPIDCTFTVYVTITDGKPANPKAPAPEVPTAEPVVYISNSVMEPANPQAGEEFTLTLTLKNSLTTKSVRNMLVTVNTGNVQIDLVEDSNIFPVDKISAGGETELTLRFKTDPSIPSGKYPLTFSFKYDSSKTLNLSSSGTAVVSIQQPANMELVMPRVTSSVSVGETIPLSFQVMNMGRSSMHNVRCVVSGFGLVPSNTGYIGTMGPGSSSTTKVELYIIALNASEGNENGSQYGDTTGTVKLLYEDESGSPYEQEYTFDTTVNRPVVDISQMTQEPEEEETAGQWWISVTILGGVILAAIAAILITRKKGKRGGAYL